MNIIKDDVRRVCIDKFFYFGINISINYIFCFCKLKKKIIVLNIDKSNKKL